MTKHRVTLSQLSVHGALTLGSNLMSVAEPLEERPAFLATALARLDDAVRELRGAVQFRSQLQLAHPSRQQRARADVEVQFALEAVTTAIRGYALRVSVIVDESMPETVTLARTLIAPLVEWERRDANVFRFTPPAAADAVGEVPDGRRRRRVAEAA